MKKIYLITYPRSGTHWMSYIIDKIGNLVGSWENHLIFRKGNKTPIVHYNKEISLSATHLCWRKSLDAFNNKKQNIGLITIVRNYKECIPRRITSGKENLTLQQIKEDLSPSPVIESPKANHGYIRILKKYDQYEGKKLLIYYEDIITTPEKEIKKIYDFLSLFPQIIPKGIDSFIKNIEEHHKECIKRYGQEMDKSVTQGNKNKLLFHSKKLSDKQKQDIDSHIETSYNDLFEKYLKRYKEKK